MADAGSKNIGKVLQKKVFRTREKVLQNLGKADKTTDDVFEQHVSSFNEQQVDFCVEIILQYIMQLHRAYRVPSIMKNAAQRIHKELKHYLTCVKEMSAASISMYRTIKEVYEAEWTGFTEVTSAVEQLAVLWEDYVNKLSNELQIPLNAYVTQFPDMKTKISKRNRKLTDFDGTRHNFEAASKKQDEGKINKAKEEMAEAKQVYDVLNEELNNELPALYSSRVGFIASHVNSLCIFESTFQHESAKLKDIMADVSEKLCREAANSGKPFVSLPRNTESVRAPSTALKSPTARDDKFAIRLNNAPASPATGDEEWTASPSSASSQRPNLPPQFQRLVSKEEERSVDVPTPKVNNGVMADTKPVSTEKTPTSARISQTTSPGLRISSPGSNGRVDVSVTIEGSTTNGSNDNDDAGVTENVYSMPTSIEPVDQVPEDRVLFRVIATHPYVGEDIDELTFDSGEVITVVPFDDPEEQDEGWLMGVKETTKQKGVFPENFTRRLE